MTNPQKPTPPAPKAPEETKAPETTKAPEETKAPQAAKPEQADTIITVRHETDKHDDTLMIGEESFSVTDGEVKLPLRLLEAAELAGFRRVK